MFDQGLVLPRQFQMDRGDVGPPGFPRALAFVASAAAVELKIGV
ncbi:MAG: hypothetical protein ACJ8E3_04995 [Sphingomicrobium sp.]